MIRDDLAAEMLALARAADGDRARSKQTRLGFSGIGHPCDRSVWSGVHELPRINEGQHVLASMRGTAFHGLLEQRMLDAGWEVERKVEWAGIPGSVDGFRDGVVMDLKTGSADKVRALRAYGPERPWRWQVQCYARALVEAGEPVRTVRIAAFAMDTSEEVTVWEEPYDPSVSDEALARRDRLAAMDEPPKPGMDPSFCEHWCAYYDATLDQGGCPSRLLGDDVPELTDPELVAAVNDMREAREDAKKAAGRKAAASTVLYGLRGTIGDFQVRTVQREGSTSVDVDAVDWPAYEAIVGAVPYKTSSGSSYVSISKARRGKR